jgi:hypothetical protein
MSGKDLNNISQTDWKRIDALTDEEIDVSDIPSLDDAFFASAKLRQPKSNLVLLASDVADAFPTSESVNEALRLVLRLSQIPSVTDRQPTAV